MLKTLLAPAVLLALVPAAYGQLTLNPTSMQFLSGQATTQNVTVTAAGGAALALTISTTYTFPLNSTAQWLTVSGGTQTGQTFQVSINTAPGGLPLANGNYHADVRFLASNGQQVTLPVDLTVQGSAGGGGTTTLVSTNFLSLSNAVQTQSFFINAQTTGQIYSISNPVNWLIIQPQSGVTFAGVATQINVTVNTGFIFSAASATLTVTVGSQQQIVTVNYNPSGGGTVGGVTLSTTQLNYALPVATSNSDTLVQNLPNQFTVTTSTNMVITFSSTTSANTSLGQPWLATDPGLGGGTTTAGVPFPVRLFIDPRGLAASTYTGTINIFSSGSLLGSVNVTLTIGTNVSPTSISVTTAGNSIADATSRSVTVSANNQVVTMTPSTNTGGGWLTGGFSGTVSGTQTVNFTLNPTGLLPATYTGQITVTITGQQNITIPVTLNVGGSSGTGGIVSPNPMVISAAAGGAASSLLTITSPVTTTYTIFPSGVTWLTFSPQSGTVTAGVPASVTVTANAATAGLVAGQTYTTTFQVSFASGVSAQSVTVQFQVGFGGTGGGAVSPSSFSLSAPFGGASTSQVATLTGNIGSFYSISSNASWLQASPSAGTMTSSQIQVSVIANPAGLGQGTYSGTLTVNIGGVNSTALVTFTVGTGSTGTGAVTPTSLTFNAAPNSGSQSQQITLNGTSGTLYSITSNSTWLTTSLISGTLPSSQLVVTVFVNPAGLTAGTYNGLLTASVSGVQQTVTVTLTVGSGFVTPSSLTFSTTAGATPPTQSLSISSSTFATYTATTSTSWLVINPTSGQINSGSSALVNVSVNVTGLQNGVYNGNITIGVTGQNPVNVPVTLNIGQTSGSGLTNPAQLSFTTPTSATPPPVQILSINSPSGAGTQNGYSIDFPSVGWLTVSPSSGTAPSQVNVSVNPAGLTQGSYNTNLIVRYTGLSTTATIPVTLSIGTTGGGTGQGQLLSHIADSAGWQTSITLVNLDSTAAQFSLRFYGSQTTNRQAGVPLDMAFVGLAGRTSLVEGSIPAGGSRTITTAGSDQILNMGWAELTTTANIRGSAVFRDTISRQEAAVTLTNPVRAFLLPFDNTSGRTTSFALVNTNPSQPVTVTATVRDENGATVGSATISLLARGHIATESNTQFTGSAGQRGVIEFSTANTDVSGLGIRFDAPSTTGGARPFTSFPVLPRP